MLLKCREKLISERTKISNWLRGQLYEFGEITSLGGNEKVFALSEKVVQEIKEQKKIWANQYLIIHSAIDDVVNIINTQIELIDVYIKEYTSKDKLCKKFMSIPYIGSINAYALSYVMEDPKFYKNGREFAARAGTTPSFTGTGGEIRILGVGHKGCSVLKKTMYQPALSMYIRTRAKGIILKMQIIQAIAKHYGLPIADTIAPFKANYDNLTKDRVHPNDEGQQVYFETVMRGIEPFVTARQGFVPENVTIVNDQVSYFDTFQLLHLDQFKREGNTFTLKTQTHAKILGIDYNLTSG